MTTKKRQLIYEKYNGKCAYCGKELTEYQIDHMTSKRKNEVYKGTKFEIELNHVDNLVAVLPIINHYKRELDVEGFRMYLKDFHLRLAKLPKNITPHNERRVKYMMRIADAFDITPTIPFSGIFYFETLT